MTDWAAKVLEGVPVAYFNTRQADTPSGNLLPEEWMPAADVLAAIAKLAEGDRLVERLLSWDGCWPAPWIERALPEAAAHIAALTAQNREMALDVLASSGQAAEAYAAQLAAEAEAAALRERVARLEGALRDMPKAVLRTTVCQGPVWPDDRPGVWLAALEACAKSVQAAVDAALTDGGKDGGKHE